MQDPNTKEKTAGDVKSMSPRPEDVQIHNEAVEKITAKIDAAFARMARLQQRAKNDTSEQSKMSDIVDAAFVDVVAIALNADTVYEKKRALERVADDLTELLRPMIRSRKWTKRTPKRKPAGPPPAPAPRRSKKAKSGSKYVPKGGTSPAAPSLLAAAAAPTPPSPAAAAAANESQPASRKLAFPPPLGIPLRVPVPKPPVAPPANWFMTMPLAKLSWGPPPAPPASLSLEAYPLTHDMLDQSVLSFGAFGAAPHAPWDAANSLSEFLALAPDLLGQPAPASPSDGLALEDL